MKRIVRYIVLPSLLVLIPFYAHAFLINSWEPIESKGKKLDISPPSRTGIPWTEVITGMRFRWVPGGCFRMGTHPDTENRDSDEGPLHEACLGGYWLAQRETTQGEWWTIMRNNPSRNRKGNDYPVDRVSWDDANTFVTRLNARYPKDGWLFRLPTEAEWEYACRNGGKNVRYSGGLAAGQTAWYRVNSGGLAAQATGFKSPNRLGLLDMSGNLWEWTMDVYQGDAYKRHKRVNPHTLTGGLGSNYRAIRGGGWNSLDHQVRCGNRGFSFFGDREDEIGFRVARVRDQAPKQVLQPKDILRDLLKN
ncbi:formylglycine-generating enzyme family protein [Magnetococcales bacterium HHB-1]